MATIMKIGGGGGQPNVLTVAVDSGAVVTATSNGKTVSATSVGGNAVLKLPKAGTWNVVATKDGNTAEDVITISDDYPVEVSFGLPLSSLAEGTLIKLNESGSGVNFFLGKHDYESGLNGAGRELLVRKDCYTSRVWHDGDYNFYASSSIDNYLNSTYKSVLDAEVQNLIETTSFYYTVGGGSATVTSLSRSVFMLSVTEWGLTSSVSNTEGSALPIASALKNAFLSGGPTERWTRTAHKTSNSAACCIWSSGSSLNIGNGSLTSNYGVHPVFTLPATAIVNPEPNADGSYTLIV